MPSVVGDYEMELLKMGKIVATIEGIKYRCWQCEKGELVLTRDVDKVGNPSPAYFSCDSCDAKISIYPAKHGVQPHLKMNMRGKGFGADQPGSADDNDGRWR